MVTAQRTDNRMAKQTKPAQTKPAQTKGSGAVKAAKNGPSKKKSAGKEADGNAILKTALQQIEKQFGEGAIMALGADKAVRIPGIATGSLSLDVALGGQGIPRGRIIEVFGTFIVPIGPLNTHKKVS